MAEIEYQVDEMLFKMNALAGTSNLPEKPPIYFTDSDGTYGLGEDAISTGSEVLFSFLPAISTGSEVLFSFLPAIPTGFEVLFSFLPAISTGSEVNFSFLPAIYTGPEVLFSFLPEFIILIWDFPYLESAIRVFFRLFVYC